MVQKIIFLLGVVGLFQACLQGKKSATGVISETNKLVVKFNVSAQTKFLINDLERELRIQKVGIKEYKPSQSICDKYNLVKYNHRIYVHGMALINDAFVKTDLSKYHITAGVNTGKTITLQIPVNNLDAFFLMKGIEYFQISEKVETK